MELRELIYTAFNNYPYDIKKTPLKDNPTAGLLRNGLNNISNMEQLLGNKYRTNGSPGKGHWAIVPWIGIFPSEFKTATKGIYIVYLFSADHQNIYLSLNQGWTYFKEKYKPISAAKSEIKDKAAELRNALTYSNKNITDNPIELGSKESNPAGYESGNILSIKYNKDALPDNNQLIKDLSDMVHLLTYLLSIVSFDDDGYYQLDYLKPIEKQSNEHKKVSFKHTKVPHRKNVNKDYGKGVISKRNYRAINKVKMDNGDYGEELVLRIEKERLIKAGRGDLADKIVHTSRDKGDGWGYDIESFDINGHPIYIEVKATTNGKSTPFNISPNELRASSKYQDRYRLYRLYNISNEQIEYYIIQGDLNDALELTPTSYSGFPKP